MTKTKVISIAVITAMIISMFAVFGTMQVNAKNSFKLEDYKEIGFSITKATVQKGKLKEKYTNKYGIKNKWYYGKLQLRWNGYIPKNFRNSKVFIVYQSVVGPDITNPFKTKYTMNNRKCIIHKTPVPMIWYSKSPSKKIRKNGKVKYIYSKKKKWDIALDYPEIYLIFKDSKGKKYRTPEISLTYKN